MCCATPRCTRFPPIGPGLLLGLKLRWRSLELARLMLGSVVTLGRELSDSPAPTAWLCGSTAHSDLTPGQAGGGAFAFALNLLGHLVGWPLPRGGAGRLSAAMVDRLRAAGGTVRCGTSVEQILCRRGGVTGVGVAGGEDIEADAVVATLSAGALAPLLPDAALPGRLMRRLRRWRYGLGTFKVDWALSGPTPWAAREAHGAAVVHLGDTVQAFFRAAHQAGLGRVPETPAMVVGQQSLHDPTRAPVGGQTL
jgi:phytoene dehydrogenase-like protein